MHLCVHDFCFSFNFRQVLARGLFMNVAEYLKENDYRTVC